MIAELTPDLQTARTDDRPSRILIVDDDRAQVEALRYRLEKLGYEVLVAWEGREALAKATAERPDAVLLDVRLPDIEGFEVCAELADSPATCGIPVIMLTGMERADIVRQVRAAGGEFFVRKPYDPNVLLALIENVLGRDG